MELANVQLLTRFTITSLFGEGMKEQKTTLSSRILPEPFFEEFFFFFAYEWSVSPTWLNSLNVIMIVLSRCWYCSRRWCLRSDSYFSVGGRVEEECEDVDSVFCPFTESFLSNSAPCLRMRSYFC